MPLDLVPNAPDHESRLSVTSSHQNRGATAEDALDEKVEDSRPASCYDPVHQALPPRFCSPNYPQPATIPTFSCTKTSHRPHAKTRGWNLILFPKILRPAAVLFRTGSQRQNLYVCCGKQNCPSVALVIAFRRRRALENEIQQRTTCHNSIPTTRRPTLEC
jgi:hypothetical protein